VPSGPPAGVPVSPGVLSVDDRQWLPVHEPAVAPSVRRAAMALGSELELTDADLGDLAIVATEVATNLGRHAIDGAVLLRARRGGDRTGVEIIAVDAGPGMADIEEFRADGRSTAGTLGIGLGAITRLATRFDIYSRPGAGTVLSACVGPAAAFTPDWVGGLSRPVPGEVVCGDGYAARELDGHRQVLLCDGLGHGQLAATAAQAVVAQFLSAPALPAGEMLARLHRQTRHTRGAVAAVADLNNASRLLRFAGIGNISGSLHVDGARRGLVSLPGILGHQVRDIRAFDYPMPPGAVLVLHSDGLTNRWNLADHPGLLGHQPVLVAATLLRDAGTRRDDAGVLVATAS
jgi:anti-sigma regulatory factor (Ser/Thr protein kinase)